MDEGETLRKLLKTEKVKVQFTNFWTLSHSPGQLQGDFA